MTSLSVWAHVGARTRSLFWVCAPAAVLLFASCQKRPAFNVENQLGPDGGAGKKDAGNKDGSGGSGGMGGAGGGGASGGAGGSGGGSECTTPKAEECNGIDDDCNGTTDDVDPATLQDSLTNCGMCGNICAPANSEPECKMGTCTIKACRPGAFDADHDVKNGCECLQSNGGVEICDGNDNNCDGTTDEGFDTTKDVNNCGGCGKRCLFPFAKSTCEASACKLTECLSGFYDINKDPKDGCEYPCLVSNGGKEACDGQDNDCNGMIDDGLTAPPSPCSKIEGVCAGAAQTCMGIKGWVCDYGADFQEVEDVSKGCDGKDNDCDGKTDEPFDIGKSCPIGSGMCTSTGTWVCDSGKPEGRRCDGTPKVPGPELCNGEDDDCDGKIDEIENLGDIAAAGSSKVAYFAGSDVTVFMYEASRPNATATETGVSSTATPCSVANKQPWYNVTKEEAAAACAKLGSGWRLCSAAEWGDACNGTGSTKFPYGDTYSGSTCNGDDYTKPAPYTTTIPTGTAASCTSDVGGGNKLYDMSGNVKEWVLTTVSPAKYELRGGAYNNVSFGTSAPGLQCDASTPAPSVDVRLPSVGFRCCRPGMLPP